MIALPSAFSYLARARRSAQLSRSKASASSGLMKRAARTAAKTKRETHAAKRKLIEAVSGAGAFAHLASAGDRHSTAARTAAAILAAGQLARAGGPEQPRPTGLAKKIIEAAAKARS
ncbi:hypothetical protein AS156_00985 [Bradyrhizobium macuxiense]|uniref:Uncharacterized protein n=1 Tax=Bradyrhizobium macuxiense TaxID=1755647 RepID=A0A120FMU4_9BRAD|nr:hypothetical protein AS156_00985 [Bradyrhizobium macuxiense]